jgi:uncharacterized membrane protein
MLVLLVPVALATIAGLVVLWPGGGTSAAERAAAGTFPPGLSYPTGTVVALQTAPCSGSASGRGAETCGTALVRLKDGVDAGRQVPVDLPPDAVAAGVKVGSSLVLTRDPTGGGTGSVVYAFQDFARGTPIVALAIAFVVVVGLVARWRGLAAILGLGFAFVVLLAFMLPALLAGESPTWVSLVGSAAIMFVVLYLAHGFSVRTTTALIGTLFGLTLVAVLGEASVALAHLTGFSSDATLTLRQFDPTLNFSGLVLAGIVVAGLGVLNDVTVTQASAVWEISEASPELGWRRLFARGMAIGRDHIASTVYTIVFAYAGAALPLLMLFEIYQRPAWTVLTGMEVGEEVIRTFVGAIALVLAVPVTTLVGAVVATMARRPAANGAVHAGYADAGYDDRYDDDRYDDDYDDRDHYAHDDGALDTDPAMPARPPGPSSRGPVPPWPSGRARPPDQFWSGEDGR